MAKTLEPLWIMAHRARLLAAGSTTDQARQEFLRIAEKLEAEALAEEPGELKSTGNPGTAIKGDPENPRATGSVKAGNTTKQRPAKKHRGKRSASTGATGESSEG